MIPTPGHRDAGDHRVEHREQFLQAEEVPRRLGRVRCLVGVGQLQQRRIDEHREDEDERGAGEGGDEFGGQEVRPRVDLVDRRRLDVLDRARLDDGEQALGVPTGTSADGYARSGTGRCARRRRRPCRRPRPRQRMPRPVRRRRPPCLFGRPSRPCCAAAGVPGCASRTRRPRVRRRLIRRRGSAGAGVSAALSRAAAARFRRCSGISVMESPHPKCNGRCGHPDHNGPEMPPSLRTRQKWIAMKMTMMNGKNNTCSTYHRRSVSEPISAPPSSTKRTS